MQAPLLSGRLFLVLIGFGSARGLSIPLLAPPVPHTPRHAPVASNAADRLEAKVDRLQATLDRMMSQEDAAVPAVADEKPAGARTALRARFVGVGSCAPPTRVTNDMLEELVDTSDEWITQRTGIRSRHLLAPGEGLSEIAATAAARALEHAGVGADEIDLVVVATSSPDDMFGDAAYVANSVGATRAVAYDITAACSGFLFAVNTAALYLHTGHYGTALVVGADALSRWVDWKDRNSCVLFGDGAGAVVMRAAPSDAEAGLLGYEMHSNGAGRCELQLPYDGAPRPLTETIGEVTRGAYRPIELNGREVYRFATSAVPEVLEEALANAGMRAADVDWLLLHQANIRILETCAKKLGVPMEKMISNLDEYGNTSAGSIPLALDEAVKSGKVQPGDVIACAGFGAGLSWGAAVIRWDYEFAG